ncbi:MAG: PhoH family protein [Bacteroidales bacterium]|nr:PhoH family protein [Bacteroidales bacterium]
MSTILNKTITLDAIDPIEILGVNNKLFDQFKSYFPQLKATSRGNEIMLVGSDDAIALFETKLQQLIQKRMGKMSLNSYDVESLFEGSDSSKEIGKVDMMSGSDYIIVYGVDGKCVKARTVNQKRLVKEYYDNDLIFALGPAGTGKTYTAIALAVRALKNREVKRLILTRPAVEAGERLGFLPGDLKDKLDPYLQPLYDALQDMIPAKKLQSLMEDGTIQIAPLAYMRGRTLDKAFVILDEAQNTSLSQLKMFLTRMGNDAKFIVTGDATQIDLPHKDDSGLLKGVEMVRSICGISVVNFTKEDIVRHPLVTKIIEAFDRKEASEKQD